MTGARSQSRDLALQGLYQFDLRGEEARDSVEALLAAAEPGVRDYAKTLIDGVRARDRELSEALGNLVEHWSWDRVAVVDRCILRIGAFELRHAPDVPPKVVLDEAIELAKRFSTQESGAFVNGILDKIYRDLPKPSGMAPPPAAAR